MATTKSKKKATAYMPFVIFVCIVLLIGGIIGGAIVGAVAASDSKIGNSTQADKPYGTRDGKTLAAEPPYEYLVEGSFEPLDCALSEELQEYTYYLCKAYYIDFDFAMALMFTESSFRADVVSGTNDYGLMQINKCNHEYLAEQLGITDIANPYQNIRAGLYLLRGLFEKYDDEAKVCMAYNMGEYGASVLWEQGIYETKYSNKVLTQADKYAEQKGEK